MLEGLKAAEDAGQVARKLIDALSQPYDIEGHTLNTAASAGIAIYPTDGTDATTLMRHADTAMYVAKSSGRRNYQFFSAEMNVRATERLRLEAALRGVGRARRAARYYQPRADVAGDTLTGAEALLRWQHPEHGLLVAGRFMPLVEETGLIHSIGEWVLQSAADQAQGWHALHGPAFAISVNISPKQFNRALLGRVRSALDASGLDPKMLELELVEGRSSATRTRRGRCSAACGTSACGRPRRLRHRLFVDEPAPPVRDRRHQDRPLLRARDDDEPRRPDRRQGDDRHGSIVAHQHHRRGRRDAGRARPAAQHGLRSTRGTSSPSRARRASSSGGGCGLGNAPALPPRR